MKYINRLVAFGFMLILYSGCAKFVQVPPPITELVGSTVYGSNATAASAVTAIYQTMVGNSVGGGSNGISAIAGLSADEFTLYPGAFSLFNEVYSNSQLSNTPPSIWNDLYGLIYQVNSAIEGISSSTGITLAMKHQLMGEAGFVRAFCYFYLVNLYGDVPLVLNTNYQLNATMNRTSQAPVYKQIIADLKNAQGLLSQNYLAPNGASTSDRVRPNMATATALLARVYLYQRKWDSAEIEATTVINNANFSLVTNLDSAFLANNMEAIWQLESPNNGFNTQDAGIFLLSYFGGPNPSNAFILNASLEYNFEPGDLRKVHWTDSIIVGSTTYYFPFKYKLYYTGNPPVEYPTIFRLAEQYLIRAEARAQQGSLTGTNSAQSDLNIIRKRAGLPGATAVSQSDILTAILHERRYELFTEYGQRWLDLKRTENVNVVMSTSTPQKGGIWTPDDQLYPIPQTEIQADANLTQNPGYN